MCVCVCVCVCVTVVVLRDVGVAAVKLEHIDAPVGDRPRVELVVVERARKPSARVTADVLVDAQLQAFRMYLQRQRIPLSYMSPLKAAFHDTDMRNSSRGSSVSVSMSVSWNAAFTAQSRTEQFCDLSVCLSHPYMNFGAMVPSEHAGSRAYWPLVSVVARPTEVAGAASEAFATWLLLLHHYALCLIVGGISFCRAIS